MMIHILRRAQLHAPLRAFSAAIPAPQQTRTILGVSLGLTASAVTFSVVAWPIADLCVAPRLIVCAMERNTIRTKLSATEQATIRSKLSSAFGCGEGREAGVCILSGGNHEDRSQIARAYAASSGRPVVYLSLREATNPHDLFFSLVSDLYLPLQATQRLVCCMGVYWLILFDLVIGDPGHVRQINQSVVLRQVRSALTRLDQKRAADAKRPLIIIDNFHVPVRALARQRGGDATLGCMLVSLVQFLSAIAFDNNLADVLILGAPATTIPTPLPWYQRSISEWFGGPGQRCAIRIGDTVVHSDRLRSSSEMEAWLDSSLSAASAEKQKPQSLFEQMASWFE